jgi:hypothetical protein
VRDVSPSQAVMSQARPGPQHFLGTALEGAPGSICNLQRSWERPRLSVSLSPRPLDQLG